MDIRTDHQPRPLLLAQCQRVKKQYPVSPSRHLQLKRDEDVSKAILIFLSHLFNFRFNYKLKKLP